MKELLELILKNSLPEDTEFNVQQVEDETGITFTLELPDHLRGKVIGREGRNIKAIRDILNILARQLEQRIYIKIAD